MINTLETKISDIIRPVIEDLGYRLVAVDITQANTMPVLLIMAENPETQNLDLDGCASISREVSAILDVEDPIEGAYRLEVSSPGIDRLLFSKDDFNRYKGHEVKIELARPNSEGRKKYRGQIASTNDNNVTLLVDNEEHILALDASGRAKLVLTDRLIEETRRSSSVKKES